MDLPPLVVSLADQITGPAMQAVGSLGSLGDSAKGLGAAMGTLGPVIGTAIAVITALTAATIGLVAAGASLSIEAAEMKDKITATFTALAGGQAAGQQAIAVVDSLTASLGMTRAQLAPLAQDLLAMGVPVTALKDQLTALATVQAVGINGGTDAYISLLKKVQAHLPVSTKSLGDLYKMGINVADVAKTMGISVQTLEAQLKKGTVNADAFSSALAKAVSNKGATALAAQADELSNQIAIAKENVTRLFEDVDVSGFLSGLKSVLGLLDQNTASGKALKFFVTTAFNAIFSLAEKVWPWIKKAIELVIIAGLKIYIAFKPVIKTFQDLFSGVSSNINWLYFFELALDGIAGIAKGVANTIMLIVKAVTWVAGAFSSAGSAAKNLIDGLVNGIKSGSGLVIDAIKNLGSSAMDALKGLLGIHSPSTLTHGMGRNLGLGLVGGLQNVKPFVANASQSIGGAAAVGMQRGLQPASAAKPAASTPSGGAGGKGGTVIHLHFASGAVVVQGGGDNAAEEFSEQVLTLAFEKVALSRGGGR